MNLETHNQCFEVVITRTYISESGRQRYVTTFQLHILLLAQTFFAEIPSIFFSGQEREVEGTLSIQPQANPVMGFSDYFLRKTVENNKRNPWFAGT